MRGNNRRLLQRAIMNRKSFTTWAAEDFNVELNKLDSNGIQATPTTYISLIRKCTQLQDTKRLHRHIVSGPHCEDRLLLNMLIGSYSKCGSLQDAEDVFKKISQRNVFSWTMMISAYAQEGYMLDAMYTFHNMLLDGSKPDRVAFLAVLESCSSISQGKRVHDMILDAGLELETCVGNGLVNLYGKAGRLEEARTVFENMRSRDVVTWNTIVTVYARLGHGEQAMELFNRMDVKPDRVTYIALLDACANIEDLSFVEDIHARIVVEGLNSDVVVCNALINMYGSRGTIDRARSVFDEMNTIRDVVSWNAIIRAYAQHGHGRNAMEMLGHMHLECVAPNEVTFVSVLNVAEFPTDLRMIRERLTAAGFESNTILANSLVHMHGKCGSVQEAKELFDNMELKNVSSWNSIVDAYVNNGLDREAFGLYRKMQHEGVKPDRVTFLTVLDVCGSLSKGGLVREHIYEAGLCRDVLLQTATLQMYARNSSLPDAEEVFEGIVNRDLFAWNSLLTAYAQSGAGQAALHMFRNMNLEGVKPGEQTFVSLLDSCAGLSEVHDGIHIHQLATECGLDSSLSVGNTLINMYGKCKSIDLVRAVFDNMSHQRNLITWNALTSAYVQHGDSEEALQLLAYIHLEGMKPDRVTFFSCLDACTEIEQVRMLHKQICGAGLDRDATVSNSIINSYRKCQSLEDAKRVFDEMKNRDVVSWTSVLCAYVEGGCAREALRISHEMLLHGDKPDSVTFAGILDAYGSSGSLSRGREVHNQMKATKEGTHPSVLPALIGMYSSCGSLEEAVEVFQLVESWRRDVLVCNAMLSAYSHHGYGRKSLEIFQRMDVDGTTPNRATFNSILDACAGIAGLVEARSVHASIEDCGFAFDVILQNTLINMYGKCGSLRDARRVFDSMQDRALVSWNSIVAATAQHGEENEARKLFRRLQQEGMKPDNVALMSVASSCHHVGMLGEAFYYLFELANEYGLKPKRERYSCIIGLLGRIGWLQEAEDVMRRMPFEPDEAVWKNLLVSCKIHEDSERGLRVVKELWKLDNEDPATYVALYNMYAGSEDPELTR